MNVTDIIGGTPFGPSAPFFLFGITAALVAGLFTMAVQYPRAASVVATIVLAAAVGAIIGLTA